jgi:acyl-CoA synthetase (AMP-forming)/AMP-acid ligase II
MVAGFAPFALLGPAFGCRTAVPDMSVTRPATLTATALADAAVAVSADSVFLSPAALRNVVDTADALAEEGREAFRRVRVLLSAGAPVGEPLLARAAELLPAASLHTPYGMTEGLLITDITLDEIRDAEPSAGTVGGVCVGRPVPGARIRIAPLDEDGRASGNPTEAPGVTGEILVAAPHILEGYDRLWHTDHGARAGTHEDRWHRTGDVGRFDERGRLWVEGRLPHVLVTADGVVTPVGVEQAVETVPGVRRAAAVGVGPRGTQQLVAVVETEPRAPRPGLAPRALADAVREALGRTIAAVLVVPQLPTDIRHNSKIDRAGLGRWAAGVLAGGPVRQP